MLLVINVEGRALNQKYFLLEQQIQNQLLVIHHREVLGIEPREQVKRPFGLDAADAGNVVEHAPGGLTLLVQTTSRCHQIVDGLIAAQRGLDCQLGRHIGAQAHVRKHVDPFDQVPGLVLGSADDHPAGTITGRPVVFGQAVVGEKQHVVCHRGDGCVLGAVVQDLVVDLVGQDDEIVFPGQLQYLLE